MEERMRWLKGGKGGSPSEAMKGQVGADGPREEGSSGALPALAPGQRRGRGRGEEGVL